MIKKIVNLILCGMLGVSPALSETYEQGVEEMWFYPKIPVVISASKIQESVLYAPNAITSYDAQDLRSLGYYTLSDVANITAGYSS